MTKKKSTKWMRKLSYNLSELSQPWRGAGADEFVNGYELACEAFGLSMHSHDESGLKCFAYLWRRFGKPSGVGDILISLRAKAKDEKKKEERKAFQEWKGSADPEIAIGANATPPPGIAIGAMAVAMEEDVIADRFGVA